MDFVFAQRIFEVFWGFREQIETSIGLLINRQIGKTDSGIDQPLVFRVISHIPLQDIVFILVVHIQRVLAKSLPAVNEGLFFHQVECQEFPVLDFDNPDGGENIGVLPFQQRIPVCPQTIQRIIPDLLPADVAGQ